MTVLFRLKATDGGTPKEEVDKILGSQFYKRVHSAQLNEAEYAPLFAAGLLFLSTKGIEAKTCSTLAVAGQVGYYWLRAYVGNAQEGGIHPPPVRATHTCI
jgi:uncharacterized MAPEG superfamily protein